ncbi:glycoside hydrolase family 70 protein [Leuconostoc carnosum]|uniref:glycoside hydrolase family 70 protein n=1 Tax=Leuconostoc carnosum TaxID=1252 RepID=UPI00345C8475
MSEDKTLIRKKLYKSGKGWVIGATVFAAMSLGASSVSADNNIAVTTTKPTVNIPDPQKDSKDNIVAPTQKDSKDNIVAPTQKDSKDNAIAPTQKDSKDNAVAPTQKDSKDNAVAPTQKDSKDNAVAPTQKDSKDNAVAPTQKDSKDNAVAPTQKDSKDNAVAPTQKDSKDNAVAPTQKDSKDNAVAPKKLNSNAEPIITGGHYEAKNNGYIYITKDGKQLTGLQNIDGNIQYFGNDGTQVKGQFTEDKSTGKTYYFDNHNGNASAYTKTINNNLVGYDKQGNQVKTAFSTDVSGNTYYFDNTGKMLTGLQTIDSKKYYLDEQGHLRKNYAGIFNQEFIYFNADGVGKTAIEYQFEQGLTSQNNANTPHNAAKTYDTKSFENVDGFLTADTWYRPTDILVNGKTWTASTESDLRPLLMTWWPDKQTQANYLNYMSTNGLGDKKTYTANTAQVDLNAASFITQLAIEKKIATDKSTEWLRTSIQNFIKSKYTTENGQEVYTNPGWTEASETGSTDHFQGGAFVFTNNELVPDANTELSNRQLNRTPSKQTGDYRPYNSDNNSADWGYELLLANDVDNSNPIVQAEQLNWLHYLMNFGTITNNDPDANFDGIRIDAVDNIDADLLQISGDYFKSAYNVDSSDTNANHHISILENWSPNDTGYNKEVNGNNQLTMDRTMQNQLLSTLTRPANSRSSMRELIGNNNPANMLITRSTDNTENSALPNYSFIRAHDSEVQTIIAHIISTQHPIEYPSDSDALLAKDSNLYDEAFKEYETDLWRKSSEKQYTHNNIPSAYAVLLTNKNTIPRVYYGDLYTDNGNYMAKNTPYFDAITTLLSARVKYVSGTQTMSVNAVYDKNYGNTGEKNQVSGYDDVLTSVRLGSESTEGIGVVVSNNPNLDLKNNQVVLHMGTSHSNQLYRPLLLSTHDGITSYASDSAASAYYISTDNKGDLIIGGDLIHGYDNIQVSGYLGVWVPVGASENQDARTIANPSPHDDNSVFHSNAALDSQLIYEGFSNFQSVPASNAPEEEYTNVKIANNAQLFNSWGVTSFQLAPQYRSSTDGTFLDAVSSIQNGYAFTDRYDLGFNSVDGKKNPTKYGTDNDLRNAIKALHSQKTFDGSSIQVMADFVPDQLYSLPLEQAVSVIRTDKYGINSNNPDIQNIIYAANIKGSGTDYQSIYGGKFLDTLKTKYNSLFTTPQISTGKPINPNTKITQWSAKYFNGTAIQKKGINYVLKDWSTGKYFNVAKTDDVFSPLPKQLMNEASMTGFISDATGVKYYSTSGYQAKNTFIEDGNGDWYYFDNSGYMVRSQDGQSPLKNINTNSKNDAYYFMPNGVQLKAGFGQDTNGATYYFDDSGKMITDQYYSDTSNNVYHFNSDGTMSRGLMNINNQTQYFAANGVQLKNAYALSSDNSTKYYFDDNGNNDSGKANTTFDSNNYIVIEKDNSNTLGTKTDYTAFVASTLRQDGLYTNGPLGTKVKDQNNQPLDVTSAGNTESHNHQKVQVTRQYTDSKGVVWNLINFNNQTVWVDNNALVTVDFTPNKTKTKQFVKFGIRQGRDKYDSFYTSAPYGQTQSNWLATTRTHQGNLVEVAGQYKVGSTTWSLVLLDGKQVWIDSRALDTNFTHDTNLKLLINSAKRNDGMYLNNPYGKTGYKRNASTRSYNENIVTVSQQYYDDKGIIWNLITLDGKKLWVDSRAFATSITKDLKQRLLIDSRHRNDGMYLNAPYRASEAQRTASTRSYNGQLMTVTKQYKDVYGMTWNLINLNGQQVWVDNRAFTTAYRTKVNQNLYINSNTRTDGMYMTAPYRASGAKKATTSKSHNGQRVQVTEQYRDVYGVTWSLANVNGKKLWVDNRALTQTITTNVSRHVKINSKKRTDGIYTNAPYGDKNAKWLASTKKYNGKKLTATKEYKNAKGVTWYLVTLDNRRVWIDQRAFN